MNASAYSVTNTTQLQCLVFTLTHAQLKIAKTEASAKQTQRLKIQQTMLFVNVRSQQTNFIVESFVKFWQILVQLGNPATTLVRKQVNVS